MAADPRLLGFALPPDPRDLKYSLYS